MPMPLDWPAREFTEGLILQGWTTAMAKHRGPIHLGRLLYKACTEACLRSGKPAAPEIWEGWCKTCGKTGDAAIEELGMCVRLVVPITGPLHCYINGFTDALMFVGDIFLRPYYKRWTGTPLPTKPKVRTIVAICECEHAGWLQIREKALATLQVRAFHPPTPF